MSYKSKPGTSSGYGGGNSSPDEQDNQEAKDPLAGKEKKLVLFYKDEYMAVRNAEAGFFLCQSLQDVYKTSFEITIRWLSEETQGTNIYIRDFDDYTNIKCVLTTVELRKISRDRLRLPEYEKERIENILKKSIGVENGTLQLPDITEENPDGLDISLYTDVSQILKKRDARTTNKIKAELKLSSPVKRKLKGDQEMDWSDTDESSNADDADDEDEEGKDKEYQPSHKKRLISEIQQTSGRLQRSPRPKTGPAVPMPLKKQLTRQAALKDIDVAILSRAARRENRLASHQGIESTVPKIKASDKNQIAKTAQTKTEDTVEVKNPEPTSSTSRVENINKTENNKQTGGGISENDEKLKPINPKKLQIARLAAALTSAATISKVSTRPVSNTSTRPVSNTSTRPVSSASTRPASSTSTRPVSSSTSTRPASSASTRPVSSASTRQVSSSTSTRPASSASTRPVSSSTSTRPASSSTSTRPASSASTIPVFSASTRPASSSTSTRPAYSASTIPVFSASTRPVSSSTSTRPASGKGQKNNTLSSTSSPSGSRK